MVVEYKCDNCGHYLEDYFKSYALIPKEMRCEKCDCVMRKLISCPNVNYMGRYPPGYEKSTEGRLTFGKAIDGLQKWV